MTKTIEVPKTEVALSGIAADIHDIIENFKSISLEDLKVELEKLEVETINKEVKTIAPKYRAHELAALNIQLTMLAQKDKRVKVKNNIVVEFAE